MRLHIVNALLLKYYYITINRLDRIFDLFYWPLISLFIWGFTTYYLRDFMGNIVINIFVGGTILWIFFQRAQQDITVYILEDFWCRNLYNVFSSPVTHRELIVSLLILGLIRSFITFIFLAVVGLLLFSFNLFGIGILTVALLGFGLMLFGWVVGIFVSSLIFRYGMRIQVFAWSFAFLMQPFSAVYYPLSSLPAWLQKICYVFPTAHLFEAMRHAFDGGTVVWGNMAYAFISIVILLVLACLLFGYCFNRALEEGVFVRNE